MLINVLNMISSAVTNMANHLPRHLAGDNQGSLTRAALAAATSVVFLKVCLVVLVAEWVITFSQQAKMLMPKSPSLWKMHFTAQKKTIRRPAGASQGGTLNVKIPAGITSGKKIRLSGQGKAGMGSRAGDLYLEVAIAQHTYYRLEDKDIYLDLPITPWEAAMGGKVTVPTLAGKINLTIPANAKSGQKMRLKGRGLPGKEPGDQFVVLQIMVPPANTANAKQLYQQMAEEMAFNPRETLEKTL
jgi:hypothetical protein